MDPPPSETNDKWETVLDIVSEETKICFLIVNCPSGLVSPMPTLPVEVIRSLSISFPTPPWEVLNLIDPALVDWSWVSAANPTDAKKTSDWAPTPVVSDWYTSLN